MHDVADSLFIRSLKRLPVERTPVWMMRQAGRYLPEYRQTRQQAGSFLALCKNPELACEVTLQPLRRYALDAAIVFSDILTIPDAMGLGLAFVEGEGPSFSKPIRDRAMIERLTVPDAETDLAYVMQAIKLIRRELPKAMPLIGFAGSPWTLACYMIEGESSRDFKRALTLMYNDPDAMHQLLIKLTTALVNYLEAQIQAGADALMIFDTWGGILTTPNFGCFSCDYLAQIVSSLKNKYPETPLILFTKGGGQWLSRSAATQCDALGLDWTCDLHTARNQVGHQVALQGNLDPTVLLAAPECIRTHVDAVLTSYGYGSGHIFNLGHGITPDVPPEHAKIMIDAVHELSPRFHQKP